MPRPARERLARLLAGPEQGRADSAVLRLPGRKLSLAVAGLGAIQTPIRSAQAKRLIDAARPAQYGHGEETLSDASVRDTWQVDSDRVQLDSSSWRDSLEDALEHFVDALGLPTGSRLTAELHSLLIYGKGQFFLPHQDSEKHDAMVATLVVMLPSVHTGGELVIDDAGREKVYEGDRDELVLVAFYADRRHEVRPVRSGHRVSLTFNLLLDSAAHAETDDDVVARATSLLREHFATAAVSEYGVRDLGEPLRLAFLLDHEYTQGGLAAGRLKGADAERVTTLQAAAERVGCRIVLGQTEIKETWDVLSDDASWDDWGDDRDDEWEDDDPDESEATGGDDVELNELLDDEMTLGWWVGIDGTGAKAVRLPLSRHEICAVTPTKALKPYQSEYEGYMGNYGNTVDRWYRRAAVVLWPAERDFAARAEADSAWALEALLERIDAGDPEGARADAATLEPFWLHLEPELLSPALRVASGLGDRAVAATIAAPFRVTMLGAEHAPLLARLAAAYGVPWIRELFDGWEHGDRFAAAARLDWIADVLPPLCTALGEQGASLVVDVCTDRTWRWLRGEVESGFALTQPKRRRAALAQLALPLARLLEAAPDTLRAGIAAELRAKHDDVLELLLPLLRVHRDPSNAALRAIADDCRTRLTRIADRPVRADGDWSIEWGGCGCAVCAQLAEFLGSPSEAYREWPIKQSGREHIHQRLDAAELPVQHTTRRKGSPYVLLLQKTDELFSREHEARERARADLAWLETAFGDAE